MPGKAPAGKKEVLGKAHTANRQLVTRDSDVRMSDGIPEMFKSPAAKKGKRGLEKPSPSAARGLEKPSPSAATGLGKPSPSAGSGLEKPSPSAARGLKRPASSPTQLVSHQRPGSRLHAAMGYDLEKSRGKTAKQNAKPVFRRPACKKHASLGKGCLGEGTERKPWVKLSQVDPQNRMHLIVGISQKMGPHYTAMIGKIRQALEKDNLTKEETISMRASLLKKYSGS